MKLFRTPDLIARQVFQDGDRAMCSQQRSCKKAWKICASSTETSAISILCRRPIPKSCQAKTQVDLTIDVDEGHQFFVRRIDFQGNTTTRDKVIRREMLIDEGDLYSQQLWETSILRLNQLGYFDPLKPEDAADVKRDTKTNTVDLLLEGERTRQELHSAEWRRVGHLGKLHRLFLFDQ